MKFRGGSPGWQAAQTNRCSHRILGPLSKAHLSNGILESFAGVEKHVTGHNVTTLLTSLNDPAG